jgi:hypothetical protein
VSDKLDRFRRLEIPEERQRDWDFVELALGLPRPVPLEEADICVFVNGRAFVPTDSDGAGADHMLLHDVRRPLQATQPFKDLEEAWHEQHATLLKGLRKRFVDSIPLDILRDPTSADQAADLIGGHISTDGVLDANKRLDALPAEAPDSVLHRLFGHGRFLRLHDKLYDLVTLREYVAIFARAIAPETFRELERLPLTTPPEVYLEGIAGSLDQIHVKARSPLRNKMTTSRVVLGGITLLPIYIDPVAGLFEAYTGELEKQLKLASLKERTQ